MLGSPNEYTGPVSLSPEALAQLEYIEKLKLLTPDQAVELLCAIAATSISADRSREDHTRIASTFFKMGLNMYEAGGCHIDARIEYPTWERPLCYVTGAGVFHGESDSDFDDGDDDCDHLCEHDEDDDQ